MNNFSRNIGIYMIIIIISILLAQYFMQPEAPVEELTYSEFLRKIEREEISSVKIIGENKIEGIFDEQAFEIAVPQAVMPDVISRLEAKGVEIETEAEAGTPWWLGFVGYLIPTIIIFAVLIFFMQRMQGGGNKVLSFGKSKARMHEGKKKINFDDVAGYEEVKEELNEIAEFLRRPQQFSAIGAKIPKGVLLVGPPGTGKTLLARAVAGEAGVPFFIISGSDFVEMFVGVGASRVRDLFEQGKKSAPCIIFVDELDAVGRQRGAGLGGGHDEREQTLNQLLVEMDGFEANEGIIVLAATNRPDVLDPALLRPGRFDRQITVDMPDYLGRKGILEVHVRKKPIEEEVDLGILAKRTPGFTGADIENLANEAAILAVRRHKDKIGMPEFDDAIDRVIAGPEKKKRVISDKDKNIVAYHETGHALMGELLKHADRTHKVSIVPRGRAGGFTIPLPEEDKKFLTRTELIDKITALLGGRASEALFLSDISTGAHDDLERSTKIARAMVTEFGMSEKLGPLTLGHKNGEQVFLGRDISRDRNYSEDVAATIDKEIRDIIEVCYNRATKLLEENREIVERIVQALKERETLDSDDLQALIKGEPLMDLEEKVREKEKKLLESRERKQEEKEEDEVYSSKSE